LAIGREHRGRLNVLTNSAAKTPTQVLRDILGTMDTNIAHGSGDLKYHLATDVQYTAYTPTTTPASVAARPSHLEALNPAAAGTVRAKQDRYDYGAKSP